MKSLEQKIDRILAVVVTLDDRLTVIDKRTSAMKETLDSHTTTLDGISKQLLDVTTDRVALIQRLERYDRFMKVVAEKLQLDLDSLD